MRRLLAATLALAACSAPPIAASPSQTLQFWVKDSPVQREANAFGTLPPERQAKRILTIGSYQLSTGLPMPPASLNVYIAGGYPESDASQTAIFGEPGWTFFGPHSQIQYIGTDRPLGQTGAAMSEGDALARADAVLRPRGLLPADTQVSKVASARTGWRITFARRIDGRVVYTNKSLIVDLDANGQIRQILGRRRPLLERTAYPTRSPQEAWALAQAGRWLTFIVEDGAPTTPGEVDRFVVRSVDLVYIEGEVLTQRDFIRPYYVFRDANDQTIYVSAIASDGP